MAGGGRSSARNRIKSHVVPNEDESLAKIRKRRGRDHASIRKLVLGFVAAVAFCIFLIYHILTRPVVEEGQPRVVTPFPAPKIMDLPQFQEEHRESLYWGTYRPQVYFGIRARTPQSLIAGLMWIGIKDGQYFMRHVCQDADDLSTYGWTHHNGRDYGHHFLVDHGLSLSASFLKSKANGSGYGGDWAVQIEVQNNEVNHEISKSGHLFFYLADEDGNTPSVNDLKSPRDSLLASGSRADVGNWQLHLQSLDNLEVHYSGFKTPHIHNLSDLVLGSLGAQARKFGRVQLGDSCDDSSNILVFQLSATFPFALDIAFVSGTGFESSRVEKRVRSLTGTLLTTQLNDKREKFDQKFKDCFNLSDKLDSEAVAVGKAAIGNMLGGLGYFYGQSKISLPRTTGLEQNFVSYWPAELFTAVPSRPFFPRGFLWDEGFHQLLIWRWDIHICLDIIGHWLDLINIDGWIPREQILGAEALSKVPAEFVTQHPSNGNPPTLFLALRDIVYAMKRNKFTVTESKEVSSFLERAFVRLEAWFHWFNTTQSGRSVGGYFWHGRDNKSIRELNPKTLSSGFDDYPRASHPTDEERHLDLRCWMLLAADCIHSISEILQNEAGEVYHATAKLLSNFEKLNQMHLSDAHGVYFDFGNHTEKVKLSWKLVEAGNIYAGKVLIREVLERPELRFVPHIGYVNLFPFMSRIIPPDSWILKRQLDLITNQSTLWTNYGLRSLSKTSSLYMKRNTEHDPPYWRGPIWMNMNYMILSALRYYSKEDGPYRDRASLIYNDLRDNLIRNVVLNYRQTGYLWEQYDQKKGKGKGAHPFTGWTSLVLLIMAEAYTEDLRPSVS